MPDNNILESTVGGKYQMYQGKPLVREGSQIVYGDMADPYMLFLGVLNTKKIAIGDKMEEVPDNIMMHVMKTDTTLSFGDRIVETYQCSGLIDALKRGIIRMDRLNNTK